jgi:glycosyltransferase involved in cell wall biosynthesis
VPRVSILLPVRNAAPTLERAINSLLNQTFTDLEIIVAHDNSTDATRAILDEAAHRDDCIRIIDVPPPGGIVAALQVASGAAAGDLLARMDADDFSHPERLAKQVDFLDVHPEIAVVGCRVDIVLGGGRPRAGYRRYQHWINALTQPDAIARERFIESPLPHPSVVMRRDAFDAVGGYRDAGWAEDYDLWLRLIEADHRLGKVPEILLGWTDGAERLSRRDDRYSLANFQRAKAHFLARLPRARDHGVVLWGAGPIGKRMARLLKRESAHVHRFIEVNPRKIGVTIAGVPVIDVDSERADDDALHLAAVGQPGRRGEIRRCAAALNLIEGDDFLCIA